MRRLASLFSILLIVSLTPDAEAQRASCADGVVSVSGVSYACDSVDVLGNVPLSQMNSGYANDIWGWTDPDTGKEYALVGLAEGTAFVDVSTPESPVYLGRLDSHTDATIWRDIKVYADHAFIVSEAGGHGIQVYDLTQLRGLTRPTAHAETAHYNGIGSSHNIVINEESGFAYAVGSNGGTQSGCSGGLHMVNIQDPLNPTFAGCFSGDGYTHDAQCVTYTGPDTDYAGSEVCMAFNADTITLVDVTNKSNPAMISQIVYPNYGYVHQGWLTEDQRYLISDDEGDENQFGSNTRTLVSDVSDLDNPEFLDAYVHPTESIDHNLYVKGRYVYASNYSAGLRILDTDVIEGGADQILEPVAFFDTNPANNAASFSGTWSNYPYFESGIVIISDTNSGLFIVEPQLGNPPVGTEDETAASENRLLAAYPNPFSDRTTLTLQLRDTQHVSAQVYDSLGRLVETLFEGTLGSGEVKSLVFDGSARPAGLYVVRVTGESFSETQRVVLTR